MSNDAAAASPVDARNIPGLAERLLESEPVLWAEGSQDPPASGKNGPEISPWLALWISLALTGVAIAAGWSTEEGSFARFSTSAILVAALVSDVFLFVGVLSATTGQKVPAARGTATYAITDRRLIIWDDVRTMSFFGTRFMGVERCRDGAKCTLLLHLNGEDEDAVRLSNIENCQFAERLLLQLCTHPERIAR